VRDERELSRRALRDGRGKGVATAVFDTELRSKVDRYDMKTLDLVGHVFDVSNPKPGDVRLRFARHTKGTPEWNDAHAGIRDFGKGCVAAIRNVFTHGLHEPEPADALEALAALSFLARRIEEAEVVKG
jgi:Protein of unknown function (Hypoth_ymh)